jgi:hypothetical protein
MPPLSFGGRSVVDDSVILALYNQARELAPIEFAARYDNPTIKVEPIMVWERDGTYYLILRGESPEERWLEALRVIPFDKGHGVGYFLSVDRVAESS